MPISPPVGPKRALLVSAVGVVVIAFALYFFWPAGVVLGLALGVVIVLSLGGQQERAARSVPQVDAFSVFAPLGLAPASAEPPALAAGKAPLAIAPPEPAASARPVAPAQPVAEPQRTAAPAPVAASQPVAEPQRTAAPAPVVTPQPVAADPAQPAAAAPVRSTRTPVPPVRPAARAVPAQSRDERGVRADLDRLKDELGDDYPDFARAARLVVSTQYASAARLQRDLQLPYSRARRLLADLESQHFVGPATGTLPRQVLLPKERLPEVEQLFAGV